MYLFEIQNTIDVTKRLIGLKLIYDENIHGKDRTLFPTNAAKSNVFNAVFKTNFVIGQMAACLLEESRIKPIIFEIFSASLDNFNAIRTILSGRLTNLFNGSNAITSLFRPFTQQEGISSDQFYRPRNRGRMSRYETSLSIVDDVVYVAV